VSRFAIAVQDGTTLWLFLEIVRKPPGDVYVEPPVEWSPPWRPHFSYHASGQSHIKSFDYRQRIKERPMLVRRGQKPDWQFVEPAQIISLGIWLSGVRSMRQPCRAGDYSDAFTLDASAISPTAHNPRTAVAIDLVAPGGDPLVHPLSAVLCRRVFTDAVPHISVSLWDTSRMFPV
jgi:hypothetical protein